MLIYDNAGLGACAKCAQERWLFATPDGALCEWCAKRVRVMACECGAALVKCGHVRRLVERIAAA